jgi:lipopolysaccharide export LptBFGC system permease protein LptF
MTVSALHRLSGVPLTAVLGYLPLVGMDVLPYLVPMAFLLAVVASYGRLSSDNEWTAICMAGIHPLRVLVVPCAAALALGLATWYLLAEVRPAWKLSQSTYKSEAIREAFQNLSPGRTEFQFGDFYLNAAQREGNTFFDAVIEIPSEGDQALAMLADAAHFGFDGDDLVVDCINLRSVRDGEYVANERPRVRLPLSRLVPVEKLSHNRGKFFRSGELTSLLRRGDLAPEDERSFRYEVHRRYALAASFLMFALLGVPTALWRRSSTQLGALSCAMGFAFLYYVVGLNLGKDTASSGVVDPALAAWGANLLGTAGALVLVRRILWR